MAGRSARPAARSRWRPREGRARGASPGGTPGSPASSAADGLASANRASSRSILARSGAPGRRGRPCRRSTSSGPRSEAAVGEPGRRRPAVTAQASVTDARSWPRRRVRRTWTEPRGPVGARQLDRGDELAAGERRDARADEERRRSGSVRVPPAPATTTARAVDEQRRHGVRGRRGVADVAGQRRPVADLDGPDDRRRLGEGPVVAPDPLVGGDRRSSRSARRSRRPAVARRGSSPSSSAMRLTSTTIRGWIEPSRSRMIRSVPPASEAGLGSVLGEQRDGVGEAGRVARRRRLASVRPRAPDPPRPGAPAGWLPGRRSRDARRTAGRSRPVPRAARPCRRSASGDPVRAAR